MKFIGRQEELKILKSDYQSDHSSLIVGYGRRRVGKSYLFHHYFEKHPHLSFEGVEGQSTQVQIQNFAKAVISQLPKTQKKASDCRSWDDALELLTEFLKIQKKKVVIFLDEYQWMAGGRNQLTALLKKYWDNNWKKYPCQMILCGSVSSYMVGKVIRSKALYGRINLEMNIRQLPPREAGHFFTKRKTDLEILKYLLVFGGVPKYLGDLGQNLSFEQNIEKIFFDRNSSYIHEYEKIFYSQFKEYKTYEKIIEALSTGPKSLEDVSRIVKFKSGGGLKFYVKNLELAQFVKGYQLAPIERRTKVIQYRIIDPFLKFYFSFVKKNIELIEESSTPKMAMEKALKGRLDSYLGLAFENYGILFTHEIAKIMKIEDRLLHWGPLNMEGAQVDLIMIRNDRTINVCEFKFGNQEITTKIIPEIENKLVIVSRYFPEMSIQKTLICSGKVQKALAVSQYFDQIITIRELASWRG